MELTAPMRASCTAAAITGPATTWVATSAPLMRSDTPPASTSRNGAGGFSVWRARVAAISRRESVELAMARAARALGNRGDGGRHGILLPWVSGGDPRVS